MTPSVVLKITVGDDAPERCAQALTVAATAVAAGVSVSLWLTGQAAWLAVPGRASQLNVPYSAPIADLLAAVLAEGTVTVCTQCAARRDLGAADVFPEVRIAGASVFVEEALTERTRVLVY
ncbi:MAG: DsrE family protein [Actinomycetota bacterium]